jgi:uncharacterized membrane protein YedE/YeeE
MVANTMEKETRCETRAGVDWTPYIVGVALGVLSWAVFAAVNSPLGITTALSQVSGGAAVPVLGAEGVAHNTYWAKHALSLNYGVVFLIGTFLGGLVSSLMSGTFRIHALPAAWREQFGDSVALRFITAFLGGMIIMFGARLADGCTSGNGLSGGLQLSLSGWLFMVVMFPAAILTASLLYRSRAR